MSIRYVLLLSIKVSLFFFLIQQDLKEKDKISMDIMQLRNGGNRRMYIFNL